MKRPTGTSGESPEGADVIGSMARAFERDRYLSALLAPVAARADLLTLAAFAGELQRIPGYVNEPMAGEIRLQWWRDTLEASQTGAPPSGHPVADAVADLMRRRSIALPALVALIDAVGDRLNDTPFETSDQFARNLSAWDGGLFRLALEIISGAQPAEPELLLLDELGAIYGLARALVETPAELAQGRIVLPANEARTHGITLDTARGPDAARGWRALTAEMASKTLQKLDHTVQRYQEARRDLRLAALPIALVRPYLGLTQHVDIATLESRDINPLKRVWQLWRVSRTGRP